MSFYHTEHGLLRKRYKILSAIALHEREIKDLKGDLIALDRTLALFGHDNLGLKGPSPYQRLFKRNELSRLLRTIARERPELTTNADIAREIIIRMGWDETCQTLENKVYRRVKRARWEIKLRASEKAATSSDIAAL